MGINNQKVLVFTSGYGTSANGICAEALVAEMESNGAQVFVISFDCEEKEYESDNIKSVLNKHIDKKSQKSFVAKRINLLKEMLLHSRTPKYNKEAVKNAVGFAEKLNETVGFNKVVSVYFPVEAVISAYKLKKSNSALKFVIYELDSVADGILGGLKFGGYIINAYKHLLEKIYKYADLIMVHKSHKECWLEEHGTHKSKLVVTDLPILCAPAHTEKSKDNSCCSFLYGGTLDFSYRSPEKMLDSLNELELSERKIDFYSKGCESLLNELNDDTIRVHGYVGKNELNRAINEADFLLSIGNAVSNSLPSKIITYMSYGKPIIHFSLQKNDVCAEYLEKYPLAFVVEKGSNPQSALSEFVKANMGKTVEFGEVCELFPMNLPEYSVKYILEQ